MLVDDDRDFIPVTRAGKLIGALSRAEALGVLLGDC
jgi:hypothetical protein